MNETQNIRVKKGMTEQVDDTNKTPEKVKWCNEKGENYYHPSEEAEKRRVTEEMS